MFKTWLSPWILVIIGIIFNILAAIISNHFISLGNQKLHHLEDEISRIDVRINSFWQDSQTIERKKEFILLFTQMGQLTHDPVVLQLIRQFIEQLTVDYQLNQPASLSSPVDSQQPLVEMACFGIAGPIKNNRCEVTNLPWIINAEQLQQEFAFKRVSLLQEMPVTVILNSKTALYGPALYAAQEFAAQEYAAP